jgi:hypothetical protein
MRPTTKRLFPSAVGRRFTKPGVNAGLTTCRRCLRREICAHPASKSGTCWPTGGPEWIFAPIKAAYPLDDGSAVAHLPRRQPDGRRDGPRPSCPRGSANPLVANAIKLFDSILDPFPPQHPLIVAKFARTGMASIAGRRALIGRRARLSTVGGDVFQHGDHGAGRHAGTALGGVAPGAARVVCGRGDVDVCPGHPVGDEFT